MKTYIPLTLDVKVLDGYLVPEGYMTYVHGTTKQFVYPNEKDGKITQIVTNASLTAPSISNVITTIEVSDVTTRLVTTTGPKSGDILLLYTDTLVGIYQYVANWVYYGTCTVSYFTNSTVGTGLTTGFRSGLPYDGLTCQVVTVEAGADVPSQLLPYKVYVDKVNSMVYFPYTSASNVETPYSVVSIHSLTLAAQLAMEMEVLISPTGFKQTVTWASDGLMYKFTFSSLSNPSLGQPVAVYTPDNQLLVTEQLMITSLSIDYSTVSGLDETLYQLTSGYYRGGNNLWDVVIAKNAIVTRSALTQVSDASTYATCVANLSIMRQTPSGVNAVIYVYVGVPGYITADNIIFSRNVLFSNTVDFDNIRLCQGEALFVKSSKAFNYAYRLTAVARSL